MDQKTQQIKEQVLAAIENNSPLKISGGNSKVFLGRVTQGVPLSMADYRGVLNYEPTELYITARAGTCVSEIKNRLAKKKQMLAFEPAELNKNTTIGGVVAVGMSGPRRPYTGSVRDYVLGIRCVNGLAEELTFGGKVMKNVAGYDLSRLMTGAFGTLGIILDVTLKVLPLPEYEVTIIKTMSVKEARFKMSEFSTKVSPVSASCYMDNTLYVRLSGTTEVVDDAATKSGFDIDADGINFWQQLRDYQLPFFKTDKPIWRLSVPSGSELDLGDEAYLLDWGGTQYWLQSTRSFSSLVQQIGAIGGSVSLFRSNTDHADVFHPLSEVVMKIHQELKNAFDPHHILNPGKMYAEI